MPIPSRWSDVPRQGAVSFWPEEGPFWQGAAARAAWWHPQAQWAADFNEGRYAAAGRDVGLATLIATTRASDHLLMGSDGIVRGFAADALARIDGLGAFIGGQATNNIRNPRGEGGVPGTATLPTNMFVSPNGTAGISYQFLGAGVEDGHAFFDLRASGTNSGAGSSPDLILEAGTHAAAATGQIWGCDFWVRLLAGAAAGAISAVVYRYTSTGASLGGNAGAAVTPTAIKQRITNSWAIAEANAGFASGAVRLAGFANGVARDATYRIYSPKLLRLASNHLPATPVLPPASAPGDATKMADDVRAASFDWFMAASLGSGFSFLVDLDPGHVGEGADRFILDFSNATENERATLLLAANDEIQMTTNKAGAANVLAVSTPAIGPGPLRIAGRLVDGAYRLAVKGRAPLANVSTGRMPSGLDRMTIGERWTGVNRINGFIRQLQIARPLSDAEMDQWVAA